MSRLGGPLALAIGLIVLPWLFPDNYYVTVVLTTALLHAILAISLNLLMGYAGQISLGHAAFFGMGAYATAIMTSRFEWSPLAALLLGLAISGSIAFLIARPVLKLKGHYLAMATLGFGVIVSIVMVQAGDLTGGPDGMGDIAELSLFGWAVDSDLRWYAVISVVFVFIVLLTANLIDSRSGRALRALHGSEIDQVGS